MRLLADESCDGGIVRALRQAGHDVLAVCESHSGAPDNLVISIAVAQGRVLVTEDKDFGQLVYASGHGHTGVILLRYPFPLAGQMAGLLIPLLAVRAEVIQSSFVVVQPGKTRIIKTPQI